MYRDSYISKYLRKVVIFLYNKIKDYLGLNDGQMKVLMDEFVRRRINPCHVKQILPAYVALAKELRLI